MDWLERVDLICKLSGVDEVEQVIPLRLVFDVYQQLSDADETNVTRVKAALRRAFTLDSCEAYKQFSRRTLRLGESVDEIYAVLKKLSSLFGGVPDQTLRYAFMAELSTHTQELLRESADIDRIHTESILSRARAVVNKERVAADQPQKKYLYPSPQRTRCIVLTALGPTDVTDARRMVTSRQNVRKTETGARCERHSRPWKNENQPASDACVHQQSDS